RTSCSVTVNARFPRKICTGGPFWATASSGSHKPARENGSIDPTHQQKGARMLRAVHTLPGTCAERYQNDAHDGTACRRIACRGLAYDPPEAGAVAWQTAACMPDR